MLWGKGRMREIVPTSDSVVSFLEEMTDQQEDEVQRQRLASIPASCLILCFFSMIPLYMCVCVRVCRWTDAVRAPGLVTGWLLSGQSATVGLRGGSSGRASDERRRIEEDETTGTREKQGN